MRSLPADMKAWKDEQSRLVPLITLYDIEVNDTTTLRLVEGDPDGTGTITYGGYAYTACAIQRQEHDENTEGEFPSFQLNISNINGVAGGYIEQNELDGRQVTIRTMLLRGVDVLTETYTISGASYDRRTAVLQLGPPNFFKRKTCPRKFQRMRCQHSWAKRFEDEAGCGYPSDQFEIDTAQDLSYLLTNSESERKFGWFMRNALKCQSAQLIGDPSTDSFCGTYLETFPGIYTVRTHAEDVEWEPGLFNAPFFYKKISGDFDLATEVLVIDYRAGWYAGIVCQSVDVPETWVYLGKAIDQVYDHYVRATAADSGVLQAALEFASTTHSWVRMVRVGSVFTHYYSADGVTWTSLGTQTVAMSAPVLLGLCLSTPRLEQGAIQAGFGCFQFRAGGDSSCERTREACRLKGNSHRYGAFPGIPKTR